MLSSGCIKSTSVGGISGAGNVGPRRVLALLAAAQAAASSLGHGACSSRRRPAARSRLKLLLLRSAVQKFLKVGQEAPHNFIPQMNSLISICLIVQFQCIV